MKASKQLIEMLTQGGTSYTEISEVTGIPLETARRICLGIGFRYETAWKISKAFPDCSAKQLFRLPYKKFEEWKRLRDQLDLAGNDELAPEAKAQITRDLQKLAIGSHTKAHSRKHRRPNMVHNRLHQIEVYHQADKSNLLRILQRKWIGFQKWLHHPSGDDIQTNSVISNAKGTTPAGVLEAPVRRLAEKSPVTITSQAEDQLCATKQTI